MTETRVTFHEANGLSQAIFNAGKRDWGKRARSVAFQLYNYEMAFRKLRERIQADAQKNELLEIINTVIGEAK